MAKSIITTCYCCGCQITGMNLDGASHIKEFLYDQKLPSISDPHAYEHKYPRESDICKGCLKLIKEKYETIKKEQRNIRKVQVK